MCVIATCRIRDPRTTDSDKHMLCKDQQCLTKFQGDETEPISFDYAHVTAGGSVVIASLISDYINGGFEDD